MIEDIRQETFLRVWRLLREGALQYPERLGAFVNSICNNVMFEQIRSSARSVAPPEEHVEFADDAPRPDELLITEERKQQVRRILKDIPEKDRELLRSVFLQEEDKDEVCRRFKIDREYLRVLLHRARQRMRQEFRSAHFLRLLLAFSPAV